MTQTCELEVNQSLLIQNAQVVAKRWPAIWKKIEASEQHCKLEIENTKTLPALIINNIHLHSCFDVDREAEILIDGFSEQKKIVYCYGVGSSQVIRRLISLNPKLKVKVVILNPFLFKVQIALYHWYDWLSAQNIELIDAADLNDVRVPAIGIYPEMQLAAEDNISLVDKVRLELNTEEINRQFRNNVTANIKQNHTLLEKTPFLHQLIEKEEKQTSIAVIGAGPSLDSANFEHLKQTFTICVDAAYKVLQNHGVVPDIVVSSDYSEKINRYLNFLSDRKCTLVAFPSVHPSVLQQWQGQLFIAVSEHPVFQNIKAVKADFLYSAGSVIHPSVDLAIKLGAKQVNLYGVDFCFTSNRTHAQGSDASFEENESLLQRRNAAGEEVLTNQSLISYHLDLERLILRHQNIKFHQMSNFGLPLQRVYYDQ